ncbi:MAG TPA: site-2 protease family protein [Planctomycetaceae bacterium]|nr:site-2 protease family protein [Planctomycetaceae bacterium]
MSESSQVPEVPSGGEKPLEITTFYPETVEVLGRRPPRVPGTYYPRRAVGSNRRLGVVLFLTTCFSVFMAGLLPGKGLTTLLWHDPSDGPLPSLAEMVESGLTYFGALMTILIAHEMGHYLQARRYRVPATMPYFIPFPLTPIGTMGAVIVQGAGVADRKSLFDIAISGPLAGLVFALPITMIGIWKAKNAFVEPQPGEPLWGMPLILHWLVDWIRGPMPPGSWGLEDNPWLFAGWVGIFITALNLMPIGQLDGGHILYTLIGKKAHGVALGLLFAAMAYMIHTKQISYGLMVVLLFVAGPRHPPTADDTVPLGVGRVLLGWLTLAFLFIGFTLNPISYASPHREQRAPAPPPSSEAIEVRVLPRGSEAWTKRGLRRQFRRPDAEDVPSFVVSRVGAPPLLERR